jgi:hypothetical protein
MKHRGQLTVKVDALINNAELCLDIMVDGSPYAFIDLPTSNIDIDTLIAKLIGIKEESLLAYEARKEHLSSLGLN